jgi:hypothetical protein
MPLGLFTLIIVVLSEKWAKEKSCTKGFFCCAEAEKVKILTHHPRSYYAERATELPTLPVP